MRCHFKSPRKAKIKKKIFGTSFGKIGEQMWFLYISPKRENSEGNLENGKYPDSSNS